MERRLIRTSVAARFLAETRKLLIGESIAKFMRYIRW
jgi:hypothetical protein